MNKSERERERGVNLMSLVGNHGSVWEEEEGNDERMEERGKR